MIKKVPKFGQNIDNLLLCKQRIQETGKLYVGWVVNTYFFSEYGLDMSTSISVCVK